jgi:hypothetical protein
LHKHSQALLEYREEECSNDGPKGQALFPVLLSALWKGVITFTAHAFEAAARTPNIFKFPYIDAIRAH